MTFQNIVILTGAGISAESGLGTFRDKDGLWSRYDLNDVATPEGFARNPALVLEFYSARRANLLTVSPNAAHAALARLAHHWPERVTLITQNVDDLHEKAGHHNVIHMHGRLLATWCMACDHRYEDTAPLTTESACPACGVKGRVRPDVVWFGEMPYAMDRIERALGRCDLFVAIGTSGTVYPAAGFVRAARLGEAHTVELNLEPSDGRSLFAEGLYGPATRIVPEWVDGLLASDG